MLCSVAVWRRLQPDEDGCLFVLRITGKHMLGNAGNSGSDERGFKDQAALTDQLNALKVPESVVVAAVACIEAEAPSKRFVSVGADLQIPFSLLEEQGFDLYD